MNREYLLRLQGSMKVRFIQLKGEHGPKGEIRKQSERTRLVSHVLSLYYVPGTSLSSLPLVLEKLSPEY